MKNNIVKVFQNIIKDFESIKKKESFETKDKILLCNCVVGNNIIIVLDKIRKDEEDKLKEFKKLYSNFKIIVFAKNSKKLLNLKSADAIYTLNDKERLISFIKRNIKK
jgi:hypothetical protein